MRNYPEYKEDFKELEKLNAEDWMIELLKKNPCYTAWGNFEDYMFVKSNDEWIDAIELDSISDLKQLDESNEVINFYFELERKNHRCEFCEGTGYNEKTKELDDTWYNFSGKGWKDKLTVEEVDVLWEHNRLNSYFKEKPTAQQVNELSKKTFIHDSINKYLCVKARAERLGVYGDCIRCTDGIMYDEPNAILNLQLWVIHPNNGASQGVYLKNIKKEDIDTVLEYLKEAGKRLTDKFSKLKTHFESIENISNKNNTIISWGTDSEYMNFDKTGRWSEPVILESVSELWELNDLNELVDFYFEVEDEISCSLQMWFIHPRKGASRAVLLRNIKQEDINTIVDYLESAKDRNIERFSKL